MGKKHKKSILSFLSLKDQMASLDKRTKLYRLANEIRKEHVPSLQVPTAAQIQQRYKFGMVNNFVKHLKEIAEIGYAKRYLKNMTATNYLSSMIFKHALKGEYPDLEIDYAKIDLSRGDLDSVIILNPSFSDDFSQLELYWETYLDTDFNNDDDDQLFVLIYNATQQQSIKYKKVARRKDGSVELEIPFYTNGDRLHCWLFWQSEDGKLVSPSNYTHIGTAD